MTEEEVKDALAEVGAILEGHFVLSSGRHSNIYAEKFRALERPGLSVALGDALARRLDGTRVDVVLAPAVGGIVLGFVTALALGARSIFAEREGGAMSLRRGFEIAPQERVLIVEDVITTGKSVKEVIDLVPRAQIVSVGCLVDRSSGTKLGVPLVSLCRLDAVSWAPDECPLCAAGVPTDVRGSRHLASK
ncbi:MAG: orotate phosphoribosyltransferase [Actinomycetota bacterium]|nr:orotate phosphoribosyltransferase [Actinomycetota bacterium]